MDIPTYAPQAIDRWSLDGMLAPIPGRTLLTKHDPRGCPCLVCADGREALGLKPLVPMFARRAVPTVYRKRWAS